MQKIYTFLFLFSSVLAFSQCPSQTLYFNTQEDVDAFKIDYPNCTTLDHDLVLMNNMGSIENLDALSNLTAVNGTLTFQFFDGTINIDGLNNLERISGSLLISNITVDQLIGFKSIVSIGEGLTYTYNTNNEVSILTNAYKNEYSPDEIDKWDELKEQSLSVINENSSYDPAKVSFLQGEGYISATSKKFIPLSKA